MPNFDAHQQQRELPIYRRLSAIAGMAYTVWWFAVAALLPQAFNPVLSRFSVVAYFFAILAGSYLSQTVRDRLRGLFLLGVWGLTLHYFYLFMENGGDVNWVVGSFVTILPIALCHLTTTSLLSYSVFVLAVASALVFYVPHLQQSVFLPGLLTILLQANLSMHARLRLIKALTASNSRFETLFHSIYEGVVVHLDGIVVDVNDSLLRMTGFKKEDIVGKHVLQILDPSSRAEAAERLVAPRAQPFEARGTKSNGTAIDVELRAKDLELEGKIYRLVTVQDIEDRKAAERERIVASTVTESLRVRDEFISIASHELKTPISSLKLQTQVLQRDIKRHLNEYYTSERMNNVLSLFDRQVDRLTDLVETMLDVSRISNGRLIIDRRNVDLTDIVRETVSALQFEKVRIDIDVPESLPVRVDSLRIQQVVENLLSNAIKYGAGKPVSIRIQESSHYAEMSFTDQGLGIAPESLAIIFDRFERAVSARHISGLGLGLYITKQIVDAHGGTITVESKLGVGSVFTVRLPLATEELILS